MPVKESQYVIRVSSDHPDDRVPVTGALYIGGESSSMQLVDERVPFELTGTGRIISGMFRSTIASSRVHVEVLASDSDAPPQRTMMAVGRTVLLGDQLLRETGRFIRTAP